MKMVSTFQQGHLYELDFDYLGILTWFKLVDFKALPHHIFGDICAEPSIWIRSADMIGVVEQEYGITITIRTFWIHSNTSKRRD